MSNLDAFAIQLNLATTDKTDEYAAGETDLGGFQHGGPMGAYAREDRVELIVDINEFYDRVKIVFPHTELEPLGLEPDTYSGMFLEESVQQLVEFCARNPKYHIVTGLDEGRSINRYVLGPHIYSLAIGDKNPCLMLSMFADPNRGLVDEDMICAALAILSDPDDRGE